MDHSDDPVLRVALIYPELLGTYGDAGNALCLVARAERRGIEALVIPVALGESLPDADIFLLGGGEDGPQRQAREALARDNTLGQRWSDGAQIVAVCAGLQIIGRRFDVVGETSVDGLALIDLVTVRGSIRRVGDLVTTVSGRVMVGFENHGGVSSGGDVEPLGHVVRGFGNDGHHDGCRAPRLWGTYAHGPVLAMNPWLADDVLSSSLGVELAPLVTRADQLYASRCRALGQDVLARP